ncbi:hypothetical protein LDENG_00005530 [Lucifuga dentata]|nr:hypothetical protein LDENG_00005530 [Lucifuga dentata]
MKRSPRRPLILKRRKLPFQQTDPLTAERHAKSPKEPPKAAASQCFPDGVCIMDHPSMSDVQVVFVPQTADLQSVIGALSAKGKECGAQGPNKFILLGGTGNLNVSFSLPEDISKKTTNGQPAEESSHTPLDIEPGPGTKTFNKDLDCSPLDDSLTNINWLDKMSTSSFGQLPAMKVANKENQSTYPENFQAPKAQTGAEAALIEPPSERPPYSYMAMIQFAINSSNNKKMTLKDIYTWIEDHFPYFREVAKPGWKNSIRHNLSLHDMFTRETSPDGKVSYWTIRPEANRCLTLDQVYKPDCDSTSIPVSMPMLIYTHQQQRKMALNAQKPQNSFEKKMKPLLPRAESYLVPVQLPINSSKKKKKNISQAAKRVRIAPKGEMKVTENKAVVVVQCPPPDKDIKVKDEEVCVPLAFKTSCTPLKRESSSSRRKQSLVHSVHEEPVILYPDSSFVDSGISCSSPVFQELPRAELVQQREQHRPSQDHCFRTPIKSSSQLSSSTPSKPHTNMLPESWKVTPLGKESQNILDFSPIRTPNGPMVTPQRQYYTPVSYCSTPFEDYKIFSSPTELQISNQPKVTELADSPSSKCSRGRCSRELLQTGGATPTNRSVTEGLVLDTMNDSLSKILVDISFSGPDDEDFGLANISWSDLIPQLK